jgi:hypothetical protein
MQKISAIFYAFLFIFKSVNSQAQEDLFKLPNLPQPQVAKIFLDKYANSDLAYLESTFDRNKEVFRINIGKEKKPTLKCEKKKIEKDAEGNIISFGINYQKNFESSYCYAFEPIHPVGAYAFGNEPMKRSHQDGTPLYQSHLITFFEDFILIKLDRDDGKLSVLNEFYIVAEKSVIKKISKKFSLTKDLQNTLNPILQNYYKQMQLLMKRHNAEEQANSVKQFEEEQKRKKEEEAKREASKIVRVADKFTKIGSIDLKYTFEKNSRNTSQPYYVYSEIKHNLNIMLGEPNGVIKVSIIPSGYKTRDYIEIKPQSLSAYTKEELQAYQDKIKKNGWLEIYTLTYNSHVRDERFETIMFKRNGKHRIYKKLNGEYLYGYSDNYNYRQEVYYSPIKQGNQYKLMPIENKNENIFKEFMEGNDIYMQDDKRGENVLLAKTFDGDYFNKTSGNVDKYPFPPEFLKLIIYHLYNDYEFSRKD